MSNYNINLLIHILKQAEQTHINLEELNDKYQAVERSNFVCNTITKIVDFESPLNFRDTSHYGRELVSTNSIYNYILSYVPKINFGRRFGHTSGLIKFLQIENQNRKRKTTIVFPHMALETHFKDTLKQMCTSLEYTQILSFTFLTYSPNRLLTSETKSELFFLTDFHNLSTEERWLQTIGKYISPKRKMILVGEYS